MFGIPASLIPPGFSIWPYPQFRKNLWPLRNHRLELGFWGCRKSFRNWTQGEEAAGATNQPGLPNNKGSWAGGLITAGSQSGIVYATGGGQANIQGSPSSFLHATIGIDLSRGSDIYGNADTVMPASVNLPVCFYLGRPA